jgi:glycosyltransferase involved in cell wall biosynthesis
MLIESIERPAPRVCQPADRSVLWAPQDQERSSPCAEAYPLERLAVEIAAPLVSVVIPTRNRARLAERAVRSALDQNLDGIEVVVILDGPDADTREMLSRIRDARLNVLCLPENVGGSEARNIGVRYSRGKWIAFLDDDDEWLPEKLLKQWKAAESMAGAYGFVASEFLETTEDTERVLPRRKPFPGEHFSEYMFARRGWNSGEGFLQTSTWLISRPLITRVPFTRGLKRCQDLDWLLRATALPETEVVVVPEVLAIFHHDEHGERVSRTADWKFLFEWAAKNRRYFTPRAYSFFIATFCVPSAAKQRAGLGAFFLLLQECLLGGRPSPKCLLLFLTCWSLTEARRRKLRGSLDLFRLATLRRVPAILRPLLSGKAA